MGDVPSNPTAIDQRATFPRLRPSSGQRGSDQTVAQARGRASSDAGCFPAKLHVRGRSTSFGSTQEFKDVYCSTPVRRPDRNVGDPKVQELRKLRNQKLEVAESKGDEIELFGLKNLNLLDDIERPVVNEDEPKEIEFSKDSTGQIDHDGFTSQTDIIDFDSAARSNKVNQGHTATLCWHLKIEYTQGLTVPDEFSQCTIHPSPSPRASISSSLSLTLQPTSPSLLSFGSRKSLRHLKVSSIGSSTPRDYSEPSSPATWSSTAIASEPASPTKNRSIVPNPDEEDPFLYIAKYIIRGRAKGDSRFKEAKSSRSQVFSDDARGSIHTHCICANHNCRTYLSGAPSKHCRFCKLPRLQPEIAAAIDRINEMKASVLAKADMNLTAGGQCEADEYRRFESLQEDMKLVEIYNAETEKRCRNGVWWEGWLIVEDLKRRGIFGSKQYVYGRDDSPV